MEQREGRRLLWQAGPAVLLLLAFFLVPILMLGRISLER
jgi:hypothetical protein